MQTNHYHRFIKRWDTPRTVIFLFIFSFFSFFVPIYVSSLLFGVINSITTAAQSIIIILVVAATFLRNNMIEWLFVKRRLYRYQQVSSVFFWIYFISALTFFIIYLSTTTFPLNISRDYALGLVIPIIATSFFLHYFLDTLRPEGEALLVFGEAIKRLEHFNEAKPWLSKSHNVIERYLNERGISLSRDDFIFALGCRSIRNEDSKVYLRRLLDIVINPEYKPNLHTTLVRILGDEDKLRPFESWKKRFMKTFNDSKTILEVVIYVSTVLGVLYGVWRLYFP